MFGRMNVTAVVDLWNAPEGDGKFLEGAVARLLNATDYPKIEKWVQFPRALFVFVAVPGDPESGAFYLYDRRARVWYWVDFDDDKFGGYSVGDYDRLLRECRFLDLVEQPQLLAGTETWKVVPGSSPQRNGTTAPTKTGTMRLATGLPDIVLS